MAGSWWSEEACYSLYSAFNQDQTLLSLRNNPGCLLKLKEDRSACSPLRIDPNLPRGDKGSPTWHLHRGGGFQAPAKENETQSEPKGFPELEKSLEAEEGKLLRGSTQSLKVSRAVSSGLCPHTSWCAVRVSRGTMGTKWTMSGPRTEDGACVSTASLGSAHAGHWVGSALTHQVTSRTKAALHHPFKATPVPSRGKERQTQQPTQNSHHAPRQLTTRAVTTLYSKNFH